MVRRVDVDAALEEVAGNGAMPVAGSCMQEGALKHRAAVEVMRIGVQVRSDCLKVASSCGGTQDAQMDCFDAVNALSDAPDDAATCLRQPWPVRDVKFEREHTLGLTKHVAKGAW